MVNSLTNQANLWAGKRKPALIAKVSPNKKGCQHRNCREKRPSRLQFVHVKQTPISRSGPRGRKEKWSDINKHPKAYRVECHKHHLSDKKSKAHDSKMRRLGKRKG